MGLILLRIAVAMGAVTYGCIPFIAAGDLSVLVWVGGSLAIVVGLLLLIGFLTPFAGATAAIGFLIRGISELRPANAHQHSWPFTALCLAVMSIALVLLGPGALSLDARLFGRREIIIPEGRRPTR